MYLWLVLDILVILIFAICIRFAVKKGFINASYNIVSIILTIVLMFCFQSSLSAYITNSAFGDTVRQRISKTLETRTENEDVEKIENEKELSKTLGLPMFFTEFLSDTDNKVEVVKTQMIDEISKNVTASLMNVISIILLFITIRILLFLFKKIIGFVFEMPVLRSVNSIAGAIIGIINGLFIIYLVCGCLLWFLPQEFSKDVTLAIDNSYIFKYFYNNNLLLKIFTK